MSQARCRAKNPSACRSPRCPGRSGGMLSTPPARRYASPSVSPSVPVRSPLATKLEQIDAAVAAKIAQPHTVLLDQERESSTKTVDKLTPAQKEALYEYTNQSYSRLNRALRYGRDLDDEQREMVTQLDSVFDSVSHRSDEPRRLYRSIRPPDAMQSDTPGWVRSQFPEGAVVTFPSYGSTTVSPTSLVAMLRERPPTPDRFNWGTKEEWEADVNESVARNVVMELVTKEGVSVSVLSHMPQETEVLLPRGQSYVVHSVDEFTYENSEHILDGTPLGDTKRYPAVRVRLIDTDLL